MCTIGDPLLDLGWLLATWPEPGMPTAARHRHWRRPAGCARRTRRSRTTPSATTRDLSAIAWYKVLACFKLGIVLEGTHARALAGKAPKPVGDLLHATTLRLFEQARVLIAEA